ncbi:Spliceosome-associated protein 49 [Friedmanniomyces endolithicus]|nr:Spliceosome-associated protein 49 [Friedmanniomyces endolithicus]
MSSTRHYDQDKDSTLYIGNLDERCTDPLVWSLMLQAGPILNVHLPKDRVTQTHQGYGFVEFGSEEDADYAAKIMNQIRLWGKPIRVNKASADKRGGGMAGPGGEGGPGGGVGAELFVGGLDAMVDERVLFETFSRFGPLLAPPKIARDEATNLGKGYGFISYATFEASDDAIANMHGQYLGNKDVTVQYAYKKDGKGERHGDVAERQLAKSAKAHGVQVEIPAMPAALVMPNGTPSAPAAMGMGMGGYPPQGMSLPMQNGGAAPPVRPPQPPPSYNFPQPGFGGPPGGGYNGPPGAGGGYHAPPPHHQQQQQFQPPPQHHHVPYQNGGYNTNNSNMPPTRSFSTHNQTPLPPPPSAAGLPARPPPSMAGYGGPMAAAPGLQQQQQPPVGFPPGGGPVPMGFAPPPQGFRPPPPPSSAQQGPPNGGGYQRSMQS